MADSVTNLGRTQSTFFRVTQGFVILLTVVLLISHLLKWDAIQVDGISLALLGVLLVTPLADLIRKVKLGDFEAEIGRDEVARAQAQVSVELSPESGETSRSLEDRIRALLRDDPPLALAKVRIELEDALKRLYLAGGGDDDMRRMSLGRLIQALVQREDLSPSMAEALRSVTALANRAIHGEYAEPETAERLALLGARLTEEIQDLALEKVVTPSERVVISNEEMDRYRGMRYRVTTITPLVENPTCNTYLLDQEGLDLFLEHYVEYAEFLIGIEPLVPEAAEAPGARR